MSDIRAGGHRLVPVPDPTVLTTEQSNRLRDELRRDITGLRELLETRLDGMDKAGALVATAQAATVSAALQARKELTEAQHVSNETAINKSEASNKEKIDALAALFKSSTDAMRDQITALTSRLDRGEGISTGAIGDRVERRAGVDSTTRIIMVLLAVAALLSPIISEVIARGRSLTIAHDAPPTVAVVPIQPK